MLRIAICEDTPQESQRIRELLEKYNTQRPQYGAALHAEQFSSGGALLAALKRGAEFALYLLDVLMPEMDGIALARALRAAGRREPILYLTTSPDYAVEAFSVRAVNYLLKPVSEEAFFAALDELLPQLTAQVEKTALVPTVAGDCRLPLSQICYVEVTGHTLHYHTTGGKVIHSKVLRIPFEQAASELLADPRFLRPHQSYLVNGACISRMTARELQLTNGERIPISRLRLNEMRGAYMEYLAQAGGPGGGDMPWK